MIVRPLEDPPKRRPSDQPPKRYSKLHEDLRMKDECLERSYVRQWMKFEPRMKAWRDEFLFAPPGSATPNPPTVVQHTAPEARRRRTPIAA